MRDIDDYAKKYMEPELGGQQIALPYRRKMVISQIVKYQPHRILEIGCGLEPLFEFVEGKEWRIVEPSSYFCKVADEKRHDSGQIRILQGLLEERLADLEKERFDMVICSSLLHEVEEPERMLEDIYKICTDETIVHINVPNAKSFHRVLAKSMGIIHDEHEESAKNIALQQNVVFDMDRLAEMVTKHQFNIIDQGSYFIKPFTDGQMFEMLEKKIIDEKVLDGLDEMAHMLPLMGAGIFVNCRKADSGDHRND